ncbi:MAG: Unknown protein [uncultured Aureispira sp.]|uniref:Uncharacterized protein n=1 Tax=uncultured Aureispira sp. TaxID=1331704 RepID=A0A6S6SD57_9BACT|nr:MAG: Unknown protein [uncultured Aureispira sp.]
MKKTVEKDVLNSIKEIVKELIAAYKTDKKITPEMIEQMKAMRELFKELKQPTIVKSVRLAYEHLGNHGSLDNLTYWEDEEIELDEESSSFEYYLGLLTNPTNKYNREEIKELNVLLKGVPEA